VIALLFSLELLLVLLPTVVELPDPVVTPLQSGSFSLNEAGQLPEPLSIFFAQHSLKLAARL
jgi:hypothetical protein